MSGETFKMRDVECIAETEQAILILTPDGEKIWVPQSQVDDTSEVYEKGGTGTLVVSAWFAQKRGWL